MMSSPRFVRAARSPGDGTAAPARLRLKPRRGLVMPQRLTPLAGHARLGSVARWSLALLAAALAAPAAAAPAPKGGQPAVLYHPTRLGDALVYDDNGREATWEVTSVEHT